MDKLNTQPDKSGAKKRQKALTALLACALIIFSLAAIASAYINSRLDLIDYAHPGDNWTYVSEGDVFSDISDSDVVPDDAEVVLPDGDVFKDEDIINILLLGTDERVDELSVNARSDAILVLSLNKKTNSIKLVSLERGMSVIMPNGKTDLLTHSFRYGGPDWVIACVQTHFNLDVDKYIRVNFDVFETLVDAVGGVDIELTKTEAAALNHKIVTNTYKLSRPVSAGVNHLNGFEALQYCRLRYTDSDWVRIERQRKTIAAILEQCRDMSIFELDSTASKVLPMIQTNLSKSEIISLMSIAPRFLDSNIEDMTIPASGTYKGLGNVDFNENSRILHEFFYGEE